MSDVDIRSVTKRFGTIEVLKGLDLKVESGKFCALLGQSGCGKSTLLRMIAGIEAVSTGDIFIAGENVTNATPAKRRIAMVFQSYALYPHMTVAQNISFSLRIAKVPRSEIEQRTREVAQMLQLTHLLDRRPGQLSGGQRQRVAIGRALVRNPQVFLFDEPLSNLDAQLRVQMRLEIARLHKELSATMIYVTHDQVEAMTLADTVVILDHGEISQIGTPMELYNLPANKFVASFVGSPQMNFLRAEAGAIDGRNATLRIVGGRDLSLETRRRIVSDTPTFELGVRPEHIRLTEPDDPAANMAGRVQLMERLGNTTMIYVETAAGLVTVQTSGQSAVNPDELVGITLDAKYAHLFEADGRAA